MYIPVVFHFACRWILYHTSDNNDRRQCGLSSVENRSTGRGTLLFRQTFVTKLSSALCTFAFSIMLSAGSYSNAVHTASQPHGAMAAIFQSVTMVPAIGCALSIIPILWYTLDDKKQKQYIEEINARKQKQINML